jgi:glyoxylase-like metal-dependent hydrolase (beta-lactamase superfamily II)
MAHHVAMSRAPRPSEILGDTMLRSTLWCVLATVAALVTTAAAHAQPANGGPVTSPRVYVLDGGVLASETARYRLTDADVEEVSLSVASFLIVHPRGVLMWDAGAVADHERTGPIGTEQRLLRRDGGERFVKLGQTLVSQLAAAGYTPNDVTYLALSHYHWDHTADANLFARATWLVEKREYDAMFSADPPGGTRPETYSALNHQASAGPYRGAFGALREAREHGRRGTFGRPLPLPGRAHAREAADLRGQRGRDESITRIARGFPHANEGTAVDSARLAGASPAQESARVLRLTLNDLGDYFWGQLSRPQSRSKR